MKVIKEICSFYELLDNTCSGAHDTLNTIIDNNLEDDLMILLEEIFLDEIIDIASLNDYLWFKRDEIYITLGIEEE